MNDLATKQAIVSSPADSATKPLADAVQSSRIQRGALVVLIVFGAGLTWGVAVIEW
jgi:3-oxoacyl-[acyl-carrier-protein] synthase III